MKNGVICVLGLLAGTLCIVIACANPLGSIAQLPTINQIAADNNHLFNSKIVNLPSQVISEQISDTPPSVESQTDAGNDEISIDTASGYWYTTHGNAAVLDSEKAENCVTIGHNKFGSGFIIKGGKSIIIDIPISSIAQKSTTLPVKFKYVYVTFTTSIKSQIYAVEIDLGSGGSISYQTVSGWTGLTSLTKTIALSKYYTIPKGSSVNVRLFCKSTAPIGQNDQWVQPRSVGILI